MEKEYLDQEMRELLERIDKEIKQNYGKEFKNYLDKISSVW